MGGGSNPKMFEIRSTIQRALKLNYSLYPIVLSCVFGLSLAGFQIARSLVKSPDLHVNKRANPDPWNRFITEDGKYVQFKYYSNLDYKALAAENEKPKYV